METRVWGWAGAAAAGVAMALGGCGGGGSGEPLNSLPAGVSELSRTAYTATAVGAGTTAATQDLLTGGLGKTGIGAAAPPAYADPANPTALELRRNALHANYRGILDYTPNGGYGRLYGPNIDLAGNDTLGEGLIPGVEYMARLDDGSGRKNVALAIQIPVGFDPTNPCIVAGPSSGSRGVYGAISSSAEWALKRGCAVALTDTGKGPGLYDPADDTVMKMDGTRATRGAAGSLTYFAAVIGDAARAAFNAAFPHRVAIRQAHSQMNPEKDWGTDTLAAVRYAFYALNQEYGPQVAGSSERGIRFNAANTMVIAGSVSNGGAAVLRAAEQDAEGLIDGVVTTEPSAQPAGGGGYGVTFGGTAVPTIGKPLIDYFTYANIYQGCAVLAPGAAMAETSVYNYMTLTGMNIRAGNRCASLADKGLVSGSTTADQAIDALVRLGTPARHHAQLALRPWQRRDHCHDVHQRRRPLWHGRQRVRHERGLRQRGGRSLGALGRAGVAEGAAFRRGQRHGERNTGERGLQRLGRRRQGVERGIVAFDAARGFRARLGSVPPGVGNGRGHRERGAAHRRDHAGQGTK